MAHIEKFYSDVDVYAKLVKLELLEVIEIELLENEICNR